MKITKILTFTILFVLLLTCFAFAHKVIIFAWVEDGMIFSESSFGSKRKAKNCAVIVTDTKGQVVHKGQTDQKGNYSFKIPEKVDSDLILKLDAGTGHQAEWRISENELKSVSLASDIQTAMGKKKSLEKSPSLLKIITGISIIFLLALGLKFFKKKNLKK